MTHGRTKLFLEAETGIFSRPDTFLTGIYFGRRPTGHKTDTGLYLSNWVNYEGPREVGEVMDDVDAGFLMGTITTLIAVYLIPFLYHHIQLGWTP